MLCIDSGCQYTGYAYQDNCTGEIVCGVIRAEKDTELYQNMVNQFERFITVNSGKFMYNKCVIEYPEYWSTRTVATSKGDMFKLAFLVGRFTSVLIDHNFSVELITPSKWKGQLPKEAVLQRVREIINREPVNHACDAVGILLHKNGRFN